MKFEIEVPDANIAFALCSAFEGGIAYWAKRFESKPSQFCGRCFHARSEHVDNGGGMIWCEELSKDQRGACGCEVFVELPPAKPWGDDYTPTYVSYPLTPGASVMIELCEDSGGKVPKYLTLETLRTGLKRMAEQYPHHFRDLLSTSSGDATTGDVLVQLAVFGEIVFG